MPGKRRLLVVSHGFPPYYGGAEHVAGHLARTAAASGRWRVQVLTSDIGGRLSAREDWAGCDVVRVHTRKRKWAGHTVPELLSFVWAAQSFRPAERPDCILANCALPGGAVARRLSRLTGAPYGVVLHGSDVPGHQNARFGWVYRIVRTWVRRIWREAAWVSAVSEPLRRLALETWPEGRVEMIPNGVDVDSFRPAESRATAFPPAAIHLVAIAQLIPLKGIQHLLAAVARLPEARRERVWLTIYGTGPLGEALRQQAMALGLMERVTLAGLLPNPELAIRLQEADAFVLPSLQEGLPLSLLEAMSCGLPVVASAVGGIPDVVRNGENGCLVPPGDEPALAQALTRLMDDPEWGLRMGAAARATALQQSWRAIWMRYEALWGLKAGESEGERLCG
jgi:glycogen(starch) synthase